MDCSSHDNGEGRAAYYGVGSVTYEQRRKRWRLRIRSRDSDASLWFATEEEALLARKAHALSHNADFGITLRRWDEIWLAEHAVVRDGTGHRNIQRPISPTTSGIPM